jgi:predicted nucleic acid-binding protein
MHKVIQLISNFYITKYASFYKSTCSLGELDEKLNHAKFSIFLNFEKKNCKVDFFFKNHLTKQLCSMSSKCLALCASHICKK